MRPVWRGGRSFSHTGPGRLSLDRRSCGQEHMDEGLDLVLTSNPLPPSLDKQTKDTANVQPLAQAEGQRRLPLISKRSQVNLRTDDGRRQAR